MSLPKHPDGPYPAPMPPDEERRIATLHAYGVLDTMPEEVYDDIVFLASHICGASIALVSLVDSDRQWFKARRGLSAQQTPRDRAFCAQAILHQEELLEVENAIDDPRFKTSPLVTADPNIRFYAGVPLVTPDGFALGTLCAMDPAPKRLSSDQRRALRALARQVMTQLELRRTIASLDKTVAAPRSARPSLPPEAPESPMEDRVRALLHRMQDLQKKAPPGDE